MTYYINRKHKNAALQLQYLLHSCIKNTDKEWTELVFLCIGSDRITGDSLGPYVGYRLSQYHLPGTWVYGTLERPVHALNLRQTLAEIHDNHPHALVIAIDASLGAKKHLGYITVGNGSIYPGAGVRKNLPAAGDVYITGIVCTSGFLEQLSLQNTRLSFVIAMADTITSAIVSVCQGTRRRRRFHPEAIFLRKAAPTLPPSAVSQ